MTDNEKLPSNDINGEEQNPARKTEVGIQKTYYEQYKELFKFSDTDSVNLFTKRSYRTTISFGLIPSHMCRLNYVFEAGTELGLQRENLVEQD